MVRHRNLFSNYCRNVNVWKWTPLTAGDSHESYQSAGFTSGDSSQGEWFLRGSQDSWQRWPRGLVASCVSMGTGPALTVGRTRIRKLVTNIRAKAGGFPVAFSCAIPTTQINIRGLRPPHHPSIQSADLTTSVINKVTLKVSHSNRQILGFLPLGNFWPPLSHSGEGQLCGCVSRSRNYPTKEGNDGFTLGSR